MDYSSFGYFSDIAQQKSNQIQQRVTEFKSGKNLKI